MLVTLLQCVFYNMPLSTRSLLIDLATLLPDGAPPDHYPHRRFLLDQGVGLIRFRPFPMGKKNTERLERKEDETSTCNLVCGFNLNTPLLPQSITSLQTSNRQIFSENRSVLKKLIGSLKIIRFSLNESHSIYISIF